MSDKTALREMSDQDLHGFHSVNIFWKTFLYEKANLFKFYGYIIIEIFWVSRNLECLQFRIAVEFFNCPVIGRLYYRQTKLVK